MLSLINCQFYYNELCLSRVKNITGDSSKFYILTPEDTTVEIVKSEISTYDVDILQSFVDQYDREQTNYQTDLEILKENKIKELDAACAANIYSGFYSDAKLDENNEPVMKLYPFDEQDQDNMTGLIALVSVKSDTPIYWKAKGELQSYQWTANELKQLCYDSYMVKLYKMQAFHILRQQVLECTTKEDVEAIVWTTL
jgi:hypothetical protein